MKNHFLAEKRVCPLVLLRIITFHPAEPEIFCSFRIEIMLAWRFDWPGFLRALGNQASQIAVTRSCHCRLFLFNRKVFFQPIALLELLPKRGRFCEVW